MQLDFTQLAARLAENENALITFEAGNFRPRPFASILTDLRAASERLRGWGVAPGMRVGIRAPNCYNWLVYDLAILEIGAVSVAFTDDFSTIGAEELCARYALALILVTAHEIRNAPSRADFVVDIDAPTSIATVRNADAAAPAPSSSHPWLIFSSGSAGGIKGMIMSRAGVEQAVDAFVRTVGSKPRDCLLLFLPLSNFQQRLMYYAALYYGFDIILTEPGRLFDALVKCNPTLLIAPPLLYEAIEARFLDLPAGKRHLAVIAGRIVKVLPGAALRQRLQRALFKTVHERFGTRMRFMITGMAPVKRSTLELCAIFGLPLYETYGLIESGPLTLNVPGANRRGTVGRPLPGVEIELAEDGEIIIRRNALQAAGYFQCADGEAERTFLGPGRLATGDIGQIDQDGFLRLVGRKKEIIVTPGGEKIHPEAIEAEIDACPDVAKTVLLAGEAGSLTVVVVPHQPQDTAARLRIERFVETVSRRHPGFDLSHLLYADEPFSRDNGLLRPNLKLDRGRIADRFLHHA